MELESQCINNISFQENSEIIPTIEKNNAITNKLCLILSIACIILFIFCLLILLIFPKSNSNNTDLFLSKSANNKNENIGELFKEKHIDSNYKRVLPNDENYIFIPLIGTNDFHGRFFPTINEIDKNSEKIIFKTGGLEYIARYINILRDEFGKNRVLYFDMCDVVIQTNESILVDG